MSVYIKGMEIPRHCGECGIEWCDKWKRLIVAGMSIAKSRPSDCPLVPVPEHGDLIERDTAIQALKPVDSVMETRANEYWSMIWADECQTLSENVPTIIPADPAEEEEEQIITKASPASLGIYTKEGEGLAEKSVPTTVLKS